MNRSGAAALAIAAGAAVVAVAGLAFSAPRIPEYQRV